MVPISDNGDGDYIRILLYSKYTYTTITGWGGGGTFMSHFLKANSSTNALWHFEPYGGLPCLGFGVSIGPRERRKKIRILLIRTPKRNP